MKKLPKKLSVLSMGMNVLSNNEIELTYYVGKEKLFDVTFPYDHVVRDGNTLQDIRWYSLGGFIRVSPETECLEKLVIALSNILPKPSKTDHPAALYIDGLMQEACDLLHIDLEKEDEDNVDFMENDINAGENEDPGPTLN